MNSFAYAVETATGTAILALLAKLDALNKQLERFQQMERFVCKVTKISEEEKRTLTKQLSTIDASLRPHIDDLKDARISAQNGDDAETLSDGQKAIFRLIDMNEEVLTKLLRANEYTQMHVATL